jgi:hypothetical protein
MRLNWHRSSSLEDRFEKWIQRLHQQRVLRGETQPIGPCPDEAFLFDLARRSKRINLSDPRVDHAATCSLCMSRLLALRHDHRAQRRRRVIAIAVTSCVALILVAIGVARYGYQRQTANQEAVVLSKTVDLFEAATVRGEQPGTLQSVSLPAAVVKITVILPRFSPTGQYSVAITHDQTGNGVVAQGKTIAVSKGLQTSLTVQLDLRNAKDGRYFLSTTHEQDQASYYYPLEIR